MRWGRSTFWTKVERPYRAIAKFPKTGPPTRHSIRGVSWQRAGCLTTSRSLHRRSDDIKMRSMRSPDETELEFLERRLAETLALAVAHEPDADLHRAHLELAESYRKLIAVARGRAASDDSR